MLSLDINLNIRSGEHHRPSSAGGARHRSAKTCHGCSCCPACIDTTDRSCGTLAAWGMDRGLLTSFGDSLRQQTLPWCCRKNDLFSGTIAENLRWGNKDATDAEIEGSMHRLAQAAPMN